MKNENFYIYNNKQALYFILHGAPLEDIGVGGKGDVYHKFPRNSETEKIFTQWKDESGCVKK